MTSGESAARHEGLDQSAIFRGKTDATAAGIAGPSIPAFVAGEELADLAEADSRIVVLTADLASANRTADFAARHPGRFFNVGIAEKNMLTIAAGLAASGKVPFAATFAAFAALLGCEQIRTDIAYPGQPVRILAHHSGMSMGYYGSSHHSLEDIAIMRSIAGLTVTCVCDGNQLRAALRASLHHPDPIYLRLGRGRDPEVYPEVPADFQFGRARLLRDGGDLTIFATGSEVWPALQAAGMLSGRGIEARVVDMHTVSPIDREEVLAAAADTAAILTVEEHNVTGGLGSAVAEVLADAGTGTRFRRHGTPDCYALLGPPAALYAHYRLDAAGIAAVAAEFVADRTGKGSAGALPAHLGTGFARRGRP
ncbi:MAG: transketolase family protein [Streptosporangiaceae bacterium]